MLKTIARRGPLAVLVLVAYWGTLFVATHIPQQMAPMGLNLDKLAHVLGYMVLTFLLACVLKTPFQSLWGRLTFVVVIALAYGAIDEFIQMFIPSRYADFYDWVADAIGALLGVAIFLVCRAIWYVFAGAEKSEASSDR